MFGIAEDLHPCWAFLVARLPSSCSQQPLPWPALWRFSLAAVVQARVQLRSVAALTGAAPLPPLPELTFSLAA